MKSERGKTYSAFRGVVTAVLFTLLFTLNAFADDVLEDDVHNSGQSGSLVIAVRNDTLAALAGTDGDNAPLQVNASGALYAECSISGSGATDLGKAESSAHTSGDVGVSALGVATAGHAAFAADGEYTPIAVSTSGEPRVTTKFQEDEGIGSADDIFLVGTVRSDDLVADNGVDTDQDAAYLRTDNIGALHVANVGQTTCIEVTPTVEAAEYVAGDCFHAAAIEIAGAARAAILSGHIESIKVTDKQGQGKNMSVAFFEADPSTICAAINGAFDPADADIDDIVPGTPIAITVHDAFADNGVSWASDLNVPFVADATSLYMALIAEETITPAVGDFTVKVCIAQD